MAEFNKSFLIKLLKDVYTYNFTNNIDINKDKKYHIFQEFLQFLTSSRLPLSRLNLKVKTLIILLCNLYLLSRKCNKIWMVITQLRWYYIKECILNREFNSQFCLISRIKLIIIKTNLFYILSC